VANGEEFRSEIGDRTASLAHEINNPLDAICNLLYLVEGEPHLSDSGRRYLQIAHEEILRLAAVVRDTVGQYRDTARRQEINIPLLLDEVLELYKARLDAKHIAVKTRYCVGGNFFALSSQLHGAFSNLLLNAADALSAGGTIQVRVCRAHEWSGAARKGLRVTFADNGCGMRTEHLARIFQPFFSTKGESGRGMGLAVVKDAVRRNGGVLRVRSTTRPGRSGSVFAMFLPAA
jgi:two-component system CheB/CheR fusion protein